MSFSNAAFLLGLWISWCAVVAARSLRAARRQGRARGESSFSHELGWDRHGRLNFIQLESHSERTRSESRTGHTPLYNVEVKLDIENMRIDEGLTMFFSKQEHAMTLSPGMSPVGSLAWGNYLDKIDSSGWSELYIHATDNGNIANEVRMYSSGYIEGVLTCVRISQFQANTHKMLLKSEVSKHSLLSLKTLIKNQIGFLKTKANLQPHVMSEEPEEYYWKHARFILFQLWGLTDGYNFAANHFGVHPLELEDILVLNSGAELPQMMSAYTPQAKADRLASQTPGAYLQRSSVRVRIDNQALLRRRLGAVMNSSIVVPAEQPTSENPLDDAHWEKRIAVDGHCSAMVRLTEGNADLMIGHTTWDDYSRMTRIFKYYNIPLEHAGTMAQNIAFSSYPGVISSTDDFYLMSSGLAAMETSIELMNPFIWDKVQEFAARPHIPNFAHVMITNRLAKTAVHYVRLLATQNTGTYSSQWMVVDYNKFKAGTILPDNAFWLLEMIPGKTHMADLSYHLRDHGYWPSFNRPFFDDIRQLSGHTAAQQSWGALYSWNNNPRAQIFATAAPQVHTLLQMRTLMNRNLYPFSGVAPVEPGHEISARMDLSTTAPIPNGGTDSKVTNACFFAKLIAQAISGPSHSALPPFRWKRDDGSEIWQQFPHEGLPNEWKFGWVQMTPTQPGAIMDVCSS